MMFRFNAIVAVASVDIAVHTWHSDEFGKYVTLYNDAMALECHENIFTHISPLQSRHCGVELTTLHLKFRAWEIYISIPISHRLCHLSLAAMIDGYQQAELALYCLG